MIRIGTKKVVIWGDGRSVNYRRHAVLTADGTWAIAWDSSKDFWYGYYWKWKCEGVHITHDLINKPVLYGGSKYGYQMCMQNLQEHMERYH